MVCGWSWILHAVTVALSTYFCTALQSGLHSGEFVKPCAHIIPESPVLAIGSQFTAFCILNETCIDSLKQDASNIFWKTKTTKVPEEQYTVINRTVSSVTLNVSSSFESPLTCSVLAIGQLEQTLHGIFITLGLPPDKPKNLTCIVYNESNLTCTWNPGRPTFLSTNFTLKHQWTEERNHWITAENRLVYKKSQRNQILRANTRHSDCIPDRVNNSCTIFDPNSLFFVNTDFWVEAVNVLGRNRSDSLTVDPVKIVKPNPPVIITVNSTQELPNALKIVWKNPLKETVLSLKYNIRYRTSSMNWEQVPEEDTATHRDSFTLQDLKPYTEYMISLCCRDKMGSGYWSDWSKEMNAVTPETKPVKGPDLWRKIDYDLQGNRHVLLNWKELDRSNANGAILGYLVTITRKRQPFLTNDTNATSYTVDLTRDPYTVTVTAYNSVGTSPTSVLTIPATDFKALPAVTNIKTFPKDKQLWVEWTTPKALNVKGYVIEWCVKSDCTIEWQQEPKTSQSTFLRGNIQPLKRYLIYIYPLYKEGHGSARSIETYLEQGLPTIGPFVRTKKVGKNEAVLTWEQIPVDKQNGFIRNYTIFYKPSNGNESFVTIDASRTEYTLSSLSGDTQYLIRMRAYTDSGGKDGPDVTFTTLKYGKGEIEAIVVPVCLAFFFATLFGVLGCFYKRDLIKKYIWPNVPDPSKSNIAQWSPQTPTRNFNSKNPPYPEGSFPDVSVVEITADDKKSFSEQDIKPLDPLKKEKSASEGHSSGIGGSSCMSSPRQSVSDSDESESTQTTSSTVQYSTVVLSGYRDQQPPTAQSFARSESTQPLLDSEERPEESPVMDSMGDDSAVQSSQYFKQNCSHAESVASVENPTQGLQPINEDHVRLNLPEASGQGFQFSGLWPVKNQLEVSKRDVLHESVEGHTAENLESTEQNAATGEESKTYLPQTVRRGGYMPQ
ncbi:interleukin-6 receptor subunit beta isoform X2 [Rhinatrema bivittatum]|uniref:interleukin-6 receptor subunit beta isoform X2 n=1 Tax=Rhinatrema bivittatum TaxID=194408 RepID=UPI00112BD5E1|nr:interleukin-6 receptor subunit beta isoform X2 [Rhinatrema bivittatum]